MSIIERFKDFIDIDNLRWYLEEKRKIKRNTKLGMFLLVSSGVVKGDRHENSEKDV